MSSREGAPEGWTRYFAEILYDGTRYHGWQIQPNAHSVQAEVNLHFSRFFGREVMVTGCGRTDTGVHADRYFLHFDLEAVVQDAEKAVYKLSRMLPDDIAVRRLMSVPADAHARYSATERTYRYQLHNLKDPFARYSSWVPYELDEGLIRQALTELNGEQDFGAFCKAGSDVTNTRCNVTRVSWETKEHHVVFHISANRFLRNMVRAITGTLVDVGRGYTSLDEFREILQSKDRSRAGASLSPEGLFLTDVVYPFIS